MTDDGPAVDPTPDEPAEQTASSQAASPQTAEAWREVLTQIDALGDSVTRWTKAAVNDSENRRHAAEIKEKLDAVGTKLASTFDEATQTDIGRSVADAADKTGKAIADVGGKVAQEAGPAVASALTGLAGFIGKAAERVGEAAERTPAAPAAGPESAPDPGDDAAGR